MTGDPASPIALAGPHRRLASHRAPCMIAAGAAAILWAASTVSAQTVNWVVRAGQNYVKCLDYTIHNLSAVSETHDSVSCSYPGDPGVRPSGNAFATLDTVPVSTGLSMHVSGSVAQGGIPLSGLGLGAISNAFDQWGFTVSQATCFSLSASFTIVSSDGTAPQHGWSIQKTDGGFFLAAAAGGGAPSPTGGISGNLAAAGSHADTYFGTLNPGTYLLTLSMPLSSNTHPVSMTHDCSLMFSTTGLSLGAPVEDAFACPPGAGSSSAAFTASASPPAGGAGGPLSYRWQWQRAIGGGGVWTDLVSGTNANAAGHTVFAQNVATSTLLLDAGTALADLPAPVRCIVFNGCGSLTTNTASLLAGGVPTISTEPSSVTECLGSLYSLHVEATGNPAPTFQWYRGAEMISFGTSDTLTDSALPANAGTYRCVVSNQCGSVTSQTATLTVKPLPVISIQPQSMERCSGQPVSLSVMVTGGTPPYSYKWFKDNLAIPDAAGSTYGIASATTLDSGTYECQVYDSCGPATAVWSDEAALSVHAAPGLISISGDASVCVGDQISLFIGMHNTFAPQYQWRKDGTPIAGATHQTFSITALSGSGGVYDCVVSNLCGSAISNAVSVTVTSPPVIVTQPVPQLVCAGDPFGLFVIVNDPSVSYRWRKNGVPIQNALGYAYAGFAGLNDSGAYDCVITNSCQVSVTTASATLTVGDKPRISVQPSSRNLCEGMTANFSIMATGTPGPSLQWRKNSTPITGANTAFYSISGVSVADAGDYDCLVSTTPWCSITSQPATLTVFTPAAAAPAGVAASDGTSCTEVVVTWNAVPGADTYYIVRGATSDLAAATSIGSSHTTSFHDSTAAPPAGVVSFYWVRTGLCSANVYSAPDSGFVRSAPTPPDLFIQPSYLGDWSLTTEIDGRRVLRFSSGLGNAGTGPLHLYGGTLYPDNTRDVWQRVSGCEGTFVDRLVGRFTYELPNSYLNIPALMRYRLRVRPPDQSIGSAVVERDFASRCLVESNHYDPGAPGSPAMPVYTTCSPSAQGLSVGWNNVISSIFASQELDLTGIPSGDYWLENEADPLGIIQEVDDSNNAGRIAVTITGQPCALLFTSQPSGGPLCLGQSMTLTVAAIGNPQSYAWRKDGVGLVDAPGHLAGAGSPTLTVNAISAADAGTYDCVVTNGCASAVSNPAAVPVCPADFNCSGAPSVQDIFEFLGAYFSGDPRADFNVSGTVSVQDIFDFLAAYFAGCA